jgi:STE24 endopeptidase
MLRQSHSVPAEFQGTLDRIFLRRMQVYLGEKTRFAMVVSALASIAVVVFLFGGLLDAYSSWIASRGLPFVVAGWLFFVLLYLASELLSVPSTLYFVFHIEKRHGFTTMTYRLWLLDLLKGAVLSLVLLTPAVLGGLWLVQTSPRLWWFWIWCFFFAFTVFITYLSPYVIEPVFNTFTPVEDGPLRARIIDLASKVGITVGRVLKMDQSKRSMHTNAYFTGMGRTKRIILFDTLMKEMTPDEILAVIAHEAGHWKRRHLVKGLALTEVVSLFFLFCSHQVLTRHVLGGIFGIRVDTFYGQVLILGFFAAMLSFLFKPVMNGLMRRLEREADRFACDLGEGGEAMVKALVKLSGDNLSNLYPHPLYALFHYSHPPVLERIREIREYCKKKGTGLR